MRTRRWRVVPALLGLALSSVAATVCAVDIRVIAVSAVKDTYLELVPQFEALTGNTVVTTWSGTGELVKRVQAGESFDLAIVGADTLATLVKLGNIEPQSRVDFVKSGIGIAVRAGAPKVDVGSSDALKQALLAARSIGYSTGPSGVYLDGLFQRMGIAAAVKPKLKVPPTGTSVGQLVAQGGADIGFQQVSELVHVSGIEFLGPLPADIQQMTIFATGIATRATAPVAARALVRFLVSPASTAVMTRNGLEPG